MHVKQYLQIYRAFMPLAAASALAACGIDLQSYGEPFFDLAARDAGVADAASNQPVETAGSTGGGSPAGSPAPVQNDADGGSRSDETDAGEPELDGGLDAAADGGSGEHAEGSGGNGGSGDHTAGAGGAAGQAGGSTGQAGGGGAAGGSTAAAVSFSDIYTGILATGCSCHNGGAGGLDLATRNIAYANLVGVPSSSCLGEQRVVPGDAEASVLFHALAHTALGLCDVPTMPRSGAQLSAAQIDQLQAWITAGARDD
jgi:hypothetical protein